MKRLLMLVAIAIAGVPIQLMAQSSLFMRIPAERTPVH